MISAPVPENESERLEALRQIQILDPPPEPEFDDLAYLAAMVCGVPIALTQMNVAAASRRFRTENIRRTPMVLTLCEIDPAVGFAKA